jgi:hypothetical protein
MDEIKATESTESTENKAIEGGEPAISFMANEEVIAHNANKDRIVFIEPVGKGYPNFLVITVLSLYNADLKVLERRNSNICLTPKIVPVMIKALQELEGSKLYEDMLLEQIKIDRERTEAIKQELASKGEQDGETTKDN